MSKEPPQARRQQAVPWLTSGSPQNRSTYWTIEEATAWIDFKSPQAVEVVTRASKDPDWKHDPRYRLVVDWALARGYEKHALEHTIGTALGDAEGELHAAIQSGKIALNDQGLLRATEVRRLWPASEGRGLGWSGRRHYSPEKIEGLVRLFVTSKRNKSREELRDEDYSDEEIKHALTFAEKRIEGEERIWQCMKAETKNPFGLVRLTKTYRKLNAVPPRGLSPDEAARARANLESWRRPRSGPIPGKARGHRSHVSGKAKGR